VAVRGQLDRDSKGVLVGLGLAAVALALLLVLLRQQRPAAPAG
jgi:hypothetical protein